MTYKLSDEIENIMTTKELSNFCIQVAEHIRQFELGCILVLHLALEILALVLLIHLPPEYWFSLQPLSEYISDICHL